MKVNINPDWYKSQLPNTWHHILIVEVGEKKKTYFDGELIKKENNNLEVGRSGFDDQPCG